MRGTLSLVVLTGRSIDLIRVIVRSKMPSSDMVVVAMLTRVVLVGIELYVDLANLNYAGSRFVKAQNAGVTWSSPVLESVAKCKLGRTVQRVYDVAPIRPGSCNVKSVAAGNLEKEPAEMAFSGDGCSRLN